jgi:hypothetical protein
MSPHSSITPQAQVGKKGELGDREMGGECSGCDLHWHPEHYQLIPPLKGVGGCEPGLEEF